MQNNILCLKRFNTILQIAWFYIRNKTHSVTGKIIDTDFTL